MYKLLVPFFLLCLCWLTTPAQVNTVYSPQGHSHNDYRQPAPFTAAWQQGFGSIEADVHLVDGVLLVAHGEPELAAKKQLDSLYLLPLNEIVKWFKGFPYADSTRSLQLMIDIKSDTKSTLAALVELLKEYPALTGSKKLRIVISGNRPSPENFRAYPAYIWFDGLFGQKYTEAEWARIPMISTDFRDWSTWNGIGPMQPADAHRVDSLISAAHNRQKKVRFWNAPDVAACWRTLLDAGADYINTDQPAAFAAFLKGRKAGK